MCIVQGSANALRSHAESSLCQLSGEAILETSLFGLLMPTCPKKRSCTMRHVRCL
jgi:hypothetical protein